MRKFVLDTRLLVRAIRSPAEMEKLDAFFSVSIVYLSSVAAQELLAELTPVRSDAVQNRDGISIFIYRSHLAALPRSARRASRQRHEFVSAR